VRVSFFGAADSSSLSSGGEADLGGVEFDGTSVVSELEISDGTSGVGFLWRAVLVRRRYNRSFRILLVRCAVSRSLLARYSRKRALGFTRRLPADKKKLQNNRHRTGTRSNGSMRRATRAHTECYPGTRGELPGRTRRATRAHAESDPGAGGERLGRRRRATRAHVESDPGARGERPGRTRRATRAQAESDPGARGDRPGRTRRATQAHAERDPGARGERPRHTRRATRAHVYRMDSYPIPVSASSMENQSVTASVL